MSEVLETLEYANQTVVRRERLDDGLSAGVEVVTLQFAGTTARVCPTRGMGILDLEIDGTRVGWDSPVAGPVHPAFVNLESRNKLGWLDGFTELFVRCGLAYMGPPGADEEAGPIVGDITLHGRIANQPAHSVEIGCDSDGAFVRGVVEESVLFGSQLRLTTEIRVDADGRVVVVDEVTNFSARPSEYQLLYHINVGPPILAEDSQVVVEDLKAVWPRDPRAAEGIDTWNSCLGPTDGYAEQAYFFQSNVDGPTSASLVSAEGVAFRVEYDSQELPCMTLWKCTQELEGGYVVGLEPGTSYPNHKSFERRHDRVPVLQPGESAVKRLVLSLARSVESAPVAASTVVHRVPDEPVAVRPS